MEDINLPPLDPKNPSDTPTIIRTLADRMKDLEKTLNRRCDSLDKKITEIQEQSNRWLPKTLWGWVLLVGFAGSLLVGCYELVTIKDHQQDVKLELILSKLKQEG